MVCQQRVRADHRNAGGLGLRGRADAGLNVHGNKYDRVIAPGDDRVELIRLGQRIHAAIKDGKGCEAVLDRRVRLRAANPQLHEFSGHALKRDCDAMNGLTAEFMQLWVRGAQARSEEHTSELQSLAYLVCRLLLEKKK